MSVYLQLRDTWLAFFIISVVLLCVILLVTLFLRQLVVMAWFVLVLTFLASSSEKEGVVTQNMTTPTCPTFDEQNLRSLNQTCSPETWDASVGDGCVCTFIRLGKNSLANYFQLYNL